MEFYRENDDFFEQILKMLESAQNTCPVLLTSSVQATDNTDYGRSKIIAEKLLESHADKMNSRAIIYRLSNTFGKWATPNMHSVVATFCYNINRDIPITISNRNVLMHFYYIDDVIDSFVIQLTSIVKPCSDGFYRLDNDKITDISLGQLADILYSFRECQKASIMPEYNTQLLQRLWRTYNSYAVVI